MSRKYSHRGYQDTDRDERPRPRSAPASNLTKEQKIQKRSLRHAIDREAHEVLRCHNCGRNAPGSGAIAQDTDCPHCDAPLHCCRTCTHFDSGARWQCRAEIEKPVGDKNKANDCAQYRARLVLDSTGRRQPKQRSSNDPKSQFENLFKR